MWVQFIQCEIMASVNLWGATKCEGVGMRICWSNEVQKLLPVHFIRISMKYLGSYFAKGATYKLHDNSSAIT